MFNLLYQLGEPITSFNACSFYQSNLFDSLSQSIIFQSLGGGGGGGGGGSPLVEPVLSSG